MDNELYRAAVKGNRTMLASAFVTGDECTETKANIVHIAVRHERYDFIETALGKFPQLVCEGDSNENTPFHIAAETGNTMILELLVSCCHKAALKDSSPWREKNSEGNTPLHVALIYAKLQFAEKLVGMDPELTSFVNNFGETPLHLAIRYRVASEDRESVLDAMKLIITNSQGGTFPVQCPPEEDSERIITLLLQEKASAACLPDSDGMTPLLRAASFKILYISAIESIYEYCPRSIEVCDSSRKTFFHLLNEHSRSGNNQKLLSIQEIHSLKDHPDFEGNTPAHLAVKNRNMFMVLFLFRLSANFAIKNKDGVSAADLLQQQSDEFKEGELLLIPRTIIDREEEKLDTLLSKLHRKGIIVSDVPRYEHSLSWRNVLGRLMDILRYQKMPTQRAILEDDDVQEFMKQALHSCPALICETDTHGQNLLHKIAIFFPDFIDHSVLRMFAHYFKRFEDGVGSKGFYLPPWRMKDKSGNTPFHKALASGASFSCFRAFLDFDIGLTVYQNNKKETPFHLLSHVALSTRSIQEVTDRRYIGFGAAAYRCDEDGLTPFTKAAREANILLVKLLHGLWPYFPYDRTKTHWYLAEVDSDGNTPLHIALDKGNFQLAQFIMEIAPKHHFFSIIYKRNKKDTTPIDLIGSAENIPSEFEQFIWSKPELMKVLLGARSLKGVPTRMLKDYTNTIGVIAALLTTITFTAAFTVPGGLDNIHGTPILMRKVAFRVFMVSDIIAMCLSMMILFCLLWTMGNQKERVVILDLAIFLLQMSFYATLVAFMMGLYVTTFHFASGIAIFACALCSLLILLMRQCVVMSVIQPIIKIAFIYRGAASSISDFLYLLLFYIPWKLKLKLHEHKLVKTWRNNGYLCDKCDKRGSRWSFRCEECDFNLHPKCALKNDILRWVPVCCSQQSDKTNGSGRNSIDNGDAQTEQVALRQNNWRTDDSEKLQLELHEHELAMTWRSYYRCDGCMQEGFHWSFHCKKCDFDLHPECVP